MYREISLIWEIQAYRVGRPSDHEKMGDLILWAHRRTAMATQMIRASIHQASRVCLIGSILLLAILAAWLAASGSTATALSQQQAKLLASDGAAGDIFGRSVSVDGDTVVVGADNDDGIGSAYVFTRSGTTWTEQQKLTPGADGGAGDQFGKSVSVDGDTVVVGANLDDDLSLNSGSALSRGYIDAH